MFGWFKRFFREEAVEVIADSLMPDVARAIEMEKRPDFDKMTKEHLVKWANENGLKVDRRKKKDFIIEQIQNHLKKEN